jgi:cell division protein FtsN
MKRQGGGTFLGLVIGVVLGLAAALAVAIYVTKVPVPFVNRGQTRTADQDAAEARKNKDWDPNSPLYGKNPVRQGSAGVVGTDAAATDAAKSKPDAAPDKSGDKPSDKAAPDDKVTPAEAADKTDKAEKLDAKSVPKPAPSADPLGDLAKAKSGGTDPFDYFVQVGAYRTTEDAEGQKAKLAMLGWEARVSERDQAGRTVFRVRVGPFGKREDADRIKEKLEGAGFETTMVRVQR